MADDEVWDLIRFGNLNTIAPLFDKADSDLINAVDQVSKIDMFKRLLIIL